MLENLTPPLTTTDQTHARTTLKQLDSLPVRAYQEVDHVGSLNAKYRRSSSYEGDGLSVSVHPEEWTRIARLGGSPTHTIERLDGQPLQFLDYHQLTPEQRDLIIQWGLTTKLITPETVYLVPLRDEEGELDGYHAFDNREDAEEEAWGILCNEPIETKDGYLPTKKFRQRGQQVSIASVEHGLAIRLIESNDQLDGVWFNDILDGLWSAPRGVLTQPHPNTYHITNVTHPPITTPSACQPIRSRGL
jgi:hypothetical protein